MGKKRIEKKRAKRNMQKQIAEHLKEAKTYLKEEDFKKLAKKSSKGYKEVAQTLDTLNKFSYYVSEKMADLDEWRSRGATIQYDIIVHNSLENMEKYYLIKRYWELVKKGYIENPTKLVYYDDVVDWSLDEFTNEQLASVIAEAEGRAQKISLVEFDDMAGTRYDWRE